MLGNFYSVIDRQWMLGVCLKKNAKVRFQLNASLYAARRLAKCKSAPGSINRQYIKYTCQLFHFKCSPRRPGCQWNRRNMCPVHPTITKAPYKILLDCNITTLYNGCLNGKDSRGEISQYQQAWAQGRLSNAYVHNSIWKCDRIRYKASFCADAGKRLWRSRMSYKELAGTWRLKRSKRVRAVT